jgi:peptidoglycan/LPS O-acetylase OafA/YrhL
MPYFSAVAGVTGAIFALVFVAMQVRLDAWIGNHLRSYAVVFTLNELAAPLFLSLISLMPHHPWQVGARIVAGLGFLVVAGQLVTYVFVRRRNEHVSRIDHFRVVVGSAPAAASAC